jgi:hypothetical protein
MASIFISHSSRDRESAARISRDLAAAGHHVWLDEWSIRVGESIPHRIEKGIEESDFLVVLLSRNAAESRWVEREWSTAYWGEVQKGSVAVLPVRLEECEIPTLLQTKKYADLSTSYEAGMSDLLAAIEYFGRLKKDRDFYRAVSLVWSEDRGHSEKAKVERALHWDGFEDAVGHLPTEERVAVQEANTLYYLVKYGLTVPELRAALGRLGYNTGEPSEDVGPDLVGAIVRFQVAENLRHHDGVFGPLTYLKMAEVAQKPSTQMMKKGRI